MTSASNGQVFISKIPDLTKDDFLEKTVTPLEYLKVAALKHLKYRMQLYVSYLQAIMVRKIMSYESQQKFKIDTWQKGSGTEGGGISCVMADGDVFVKAGVNISAMWGEMSHHNVQMLRKAGKNIPDGGKITYYATGISCVLHPRNPFVPSFHFNYRYFEVTNGEQDSWWVAGNCNMTPYYVDLEVFGTFHKTLKNICDQFSPTFYTEFKDKEDSSRYIPHREEHRGIGGITFDFNDSHDVDYFDFIVSCGEAMLPLYVPILEKHKNDKYDDCHTTWQEIRRGRYIEYCLMYERGIRFGLMAPGILVENVLMGFPLNARWDSLYEVEPGSEEEKMMDILRNKPKVWV